MTATRITHANGGKMLDRKRKQEQNKDRERKKKRQREKIY